LKGFAAFLLAMALPAQALTPAAKEFLDLSRKLEPAHCEKRQLRRQMALAVAENRGDDRRKLERRMAEINRDPSVEKMEKRLAALEPIVSKSSDPEDLQKISLQQREAFYRCD
jgi:hypothetical protein